MHGGNISEERLSRTPSICYDAAMALFTGKGDGGTTKLFDSKPGERVSKSALVFESLGMLDELNTLVGWCRVEAENSGQKAVGRNALDTVSMLQDVQNHLFTIQAEVAGAPKRVPDESAPALGAFINDIERQLPPITTFLVPGGTELSSRLDIARAVSRRVERRLVALHESGERSISETSRAYANRLSSLLYALARAVNHHAGVKESAPTYRS